MLGRILLIIAVCSGMMTLNPRELVAKKLSPVYGDFNCQIDRVVDGDTIKCQKILELPPLVGENILVRLRGIDTPELRSENLQERVMAKYAKIALEKFINKGLVSEKYLELKRVGRDKYFRLVADVYVGGKNLTEFLLQAQLGCPYSGGKRQKLIHYIEGNKLNCLSF